MHPLWVFAARMQMGQELVQQKQEQPAQNKTACGGNPANLPQLLRLFNGGDEQGPNRRRNHDAGGKAQKNPLDTGTDFFPEEKDQGRA